MWIIKIIKIKCSNPSRILNEHWCIYSCLQIPPRENWFQYVRRVYATAINFPCIITLVKTNTYVNPLDTDYNTTNTQEGKINYRQGIKNRQDKCRKSHFCHFVRRKLLYYLNVIYGLFIFRTKWDTNLWGSA